MTSVLKKLTLLTVAAVCATPVLVAGLPAQETIDIHKQTVERVYGGPTLPAIDKNGLLMNGITADGPTVG